MFTRLIADLARQLHDEDLSVVEVAALHLLDQSSTMRVTEVATALALSPSAASRALDGLVKKTLVDRTEDPADRRAKVLRLTARGREFVAHASMERAKLILVTMEKYVPATVLRTVLRTMELVKLPARD
jgi:DNA-binding MarR family transcriptional regulator